MTTDGTFFTAMQEKSWVLIDLSFLERGGILNREKE